MNTHNIQPKNFGRNSCLILIGILIVITWLPITDHIADASLDEGFNRALASFAIAKGLNMVVSLIQSAQFGVGFSISPGEMLDPLNDLVEEFSSVMLFATIAFSIQKILISIGGHILVKSLLSVLAIAVGWLMLKDIPIPNWLRSALILTVLIRLAIPVATITSDAAYQAFLEPQYNASKEGLKESWLKLDALNPSAPQASPQAEPAAQGTTTQTDATPSTQDHWWSKAKSVAAQAVSSNPANLMHGVSTKFHGMYQQIQKIGEQVTRDVVSQIVVFLLQTMIFPIGLLWVLYKVALSLVFRPKN
jgi:hypothetical protein